MKKLINKFTLVVIIFFGKILNIYAKSVFGDLDNYNIGIKPMYWVAPTFMERLDPRSGDPLFFRILTRVVIVIIWIIIYIKRKRKKKEWIVDSDLQK